MAHVTDNIVPFFKSLARGSMTLLFRYKRLWKRLKVLLVRIRKRQRHAQTRVYFLLLSSFSSHNSTMLETGYFRSYYFWILGNLFEFISQTVVYSVLA